MKQEWLKLSFSATTNTQVRQHEELPFKTLEGSQAGSRRPGLHKVKGPSNNGTKHYSAKFANFDQPYSKDYSFKYHIFQ